MTEFAEEEEEKKYLNFFIDWALYCVCRPVGVQRTGGVVVITVNDLDIVRRSTNGMFSFNKGQHNG